MDIPLTDCKDTRISLLSEVIMLQTQKRAGVIRMSPRQGTRTDMSILPPVDFANLSFSNQNLLGRESVSATLKGPYCFNMGHR